MKSHWVPVKPMSTPQTYGSDIIKIIDEQIEWYDQNSTRWEDDYIKANLKLIKNLAETIDDPVEIMFIRKMVDTFCDIIKTQREVIQVLEDAAYFQSLSCDPPQHNFMPSYIAPAEGFTNDDQIKEAFAAYMKKEGKSSFTTNDYILRVQNLWQNYEHEYRTGQLKEEQEYLVAEEQISLEFPLLNAYRHINVLNRYVALNMEKNAGDRNWANIRAAINTFGKAVCGEDYEKVKTKPKETQSKDFSKYIFNGKTYGKSRLVLAVVKQYVEDYHPATFDELKEAFPNDLQGSLGVVRRIEDVSDKYKGIGGVKRYFVNEDEFIHLKSGDQVIVCTQWGVNIEKFIEHTNNELGYKIEKA